MSMLLAEAQAALVHRYRRALMAGLVMRVAVEQVEAVVVRHVVVTMEVMEPINQPTQAAVTANVLTSVLGAK